MNGKGVIGAVFTLLAWICVLTLLAAMFMSGDNFYAEKALGYIHYMAIIFGLGLLFTGGITRFANLIFLLIAGFMMMMPLDSETSVTAMPKNRQPYKVIYYNASSTNTGGDADALALQAEQPDVLILTGANPENFTGYGTMRNMFSSQFCSFKGEGETSMAVMGNIMLKCKIGVFDGHPLALIQAPDGKQMFLVNAPLPIDEEHWAKRNAYIAKLQEYINSNGGARDKIVVGSLNISPYSKILKNFLKENDFIGLESSYKATYYPEAIKYDYAVTYRDENLNKNNILEKLSSRHKPLLIEWN